MLARKSQKSDKVIKNGKPMVYSKNDTARPTGLER
jgi:hypothetical protein